MSSTAVAHAVVDTLITGGVEHVVLAPGSRSAALAFALHAAQDRLTLHTRIDERSAGFLALGIAKTSRKPVAVVTTSGTATANLHPAILEAHHAGVRLVAITADRPVALRGTNANQTTNQVELYGDAVREFADVAPGDVEGAVAAVQRALEVRGPSHLNLQFEEPLVPTGVVEPPRVVEPVETSGSSSLSRRLGSSSLSRRHGSSSLSRRLGSSSLSRRQLGTTSSPWSSRATTPACAPGSSRSSTAGRCSRSPAAAHAPGRTPSAPTGCSLPTSR